MPLITKINTFDISLSEFLDACSGIELKELTLFLKNPRYQDKIDNIPESVKRDFLRMYGIRFCRECGCTDDDCRQCIIKTGEPCHWVDLDLCSACENL